MQSPVAKNPPPRAPIKGRKYPVPRKKGQMTDNDKKKGGDFLRFLVTIGAAALVVIILGLYSLHRIFEVGPSPSRLDFSHVITGRLLLSKAPVSPDTARVFFTTDGRHLSAEVVEIPEDLTLYQRTHRLLTRLLKAPESKYFQPVLPDDVKVRGLYLVDDAVTVDFSKGLTENFRGGIITEMLMVYSIVDTIVLNVQEVNRVQILIGGKVVPTLGGEVDISRPLGANLNLVRW